MSPEKHNSIKSRVWYKREEGRGRWIKEFWPADTGYHWVFATSEILKWLQTVKTSATIKVTLIEMAIRTLLERAIASSTWPHKNYIHKIIGKTETKLSIFCCILNYKYTHHISHHSGYLSHCRSKTSLSEQLVYKLKVKYKSISHQFLYYLQQFISIKQAILV